MADVDIAGAIDGAAGATGDLAGDLALQSVVGCVAVAAGQAGARLAGSGLLACACTLTAAARIRHAIASTAAGVSTVGGAGLRSGLAGTIAGNSQVSAVALTSNAAAGVGVAEGRSRVSGSAGVRYRAHASSAGNSLVTAWTFGVPIELSGRSSGGSLVSADRATGVTILHGASTSARSWVQPAVLNQHGHASGGSHGASLVHGRLVGSWVIRGWSGGYSRVQGRLV